MLLRDLLEAQNYDEMFAFWDKAIAANAAGGESESHKSIIVADQLIREKGRCKAWADKAAKELGKKDRVIWFLRIVKQSTIHAVLDYRKATDKHVTDILDREMTKLNIQDETNNQGGPAWIYRALEHYLSLPIPKIQNFDFQRQSWQEIEAIFVPLEKEWQEKRAGTLPFDPKVTVFLECGGGFAWYDLEKGYCSQEAGAMGHCGNVNGQYNSHEDILSLREVVEEGKEKLFRVCLTFILNTVTMTLGEMKGRGNDKPSEKYHPQIIKLLEDPRIKGIHGGGYLPAHNFSIFDLPKATVEKMLAEKPGLASISERIEHYGLDSIPAQEITRLFQSDKDVQFNGKNIEVTLAPNMDVFMKTFCKGNHELEYLTKVISGDEFIESSGYKPDNHQYDNMMSKWVTDKFKALAKKSWAQEAKDAEVDVDWKSVDSIVDYMEEEQPNAYDELQIAYWQAEESAVQDEIYHFFEKTMKDGFECNVVLDTPEGDSQQEEIEVSFVYENWDSPVVAVLDLKTILINLFQDVSGVSEVTAVQISPKHNAISFPYYGFQGEDMDGAFERYFRDYGFGEIFPETEEPVKKVAKK